MRRAAVCPAVLSLALLSSQAFAAMKTVPLEWNVGSDTFSGVLVYDDETRDPRPGLVMVPNWMGVTEAAIERAKSVADDDYVVLVADVYGKDMRPKDGGEAGKATAGDHGISPADGVRRGRRRGEAPHQPPRRPVRRIARYRKPAGARYAPEHAPFHARVLA